MRYFGGRPSPNAPNLSRTGPVRNACMRLRSVRVARSAAPWGDAMNGACEVVQGVCDEAQHVADGQENARQDRAHSAISMRALTTSVRWQIGSRLGGVAHQGGDVVGQHLGSHVHQQRMLTQA
jgi:hypothetical protein